MFIVFLQELEEPGEDPTKYDVFMPTMVRPKRMLNSEVPLETFEHIEVLQ